VFLLILDSLGNTELLFILVMALIFFGPRKLPQISRSLGKSLAEFRRASEDFKRTWEREVALENPPAEAAADHSMLGEDNSIPHNSITDTNGHDDTNLENPRVEPVPAERIVPRETTLISAEATTTATDKSDSTSSSIPAEPLRKRDWL